MSGYPTTGSFSRTAVNATFGATSLVACALSSVLVFLACYVLLPVVALLPLSALAPIIIQGAIGVVDIHAFKVAFKANKAEFVVMLATAIVSLALSVKEGLVVGVVLSVLNTMYNLGNPNLAVCGRRPDGQFRDVRNFQDAEILPKAVVVRMDARLSFVNARKLREFCLKALQVRELQGETITFVIIDAKAINHVDITGCEMLESLAESLHARDQQLIVANLKGPVSACLQAAGVPNMLKKHNGHLCIDMQHAMGIVSGECPTKSAAHVRDLILRVHSAQNAMPATSFLGACSSPCEDRSAAACAGVKERAGDFLSPSGSKRSLHSNDSAPSDRAVNGTKPKEGQQKKDPVAEAQRPTVQRWLPCGIASGEPTGCLKFSRRSA